MSNIEILFILITLALTPSLPLMDNYLSVKFPKLRSGLNILTFAALPIILGVTIFLIFRSIFFIVLGY